MKILYVLNSGKPGGVEQHVLDLTKGMARKNCEVFVWCKNGVIANWYREAGARVTTKNINFEIDPIYILSLIKFIKDNKIDVVHAHELKAGVNAIIAAKFAGVTARISHVHTPISEWRISNVLKRLLVKIESHAYARFVNVFSSTEIALTASRKTIKVIEGIKPEKITIIPNGIDTKIYKPAYSLRHEILTKFNIPYDAIVIGNTGRMTLEKGHEVLIKGFAKALNSYSPERPVYLLLAGGGELEESLKLLAKNLKIESKVIVTGVFERDYLEKFYNTFDIFIFPSLAEGFGLVLIEAMANALPVISSDLEVLREVGGPDVVYFKSQDSDDLKDKIVDMLKTTSVEKTEIGIKLRNRVTENFSLDEFIENYFSLYQNLLKKS